MSEKHTPTPWSNWDGRSNEFGRYDDEGYKKLGNCELADDSAFLCRAVNSYEAVREALEDIAKGMVPPEVSKHLETDTPAEFRSRMWTWSQKRARVALAEEH